MEKINILFSFLYYFEPISAAWYSVTVCEDVNKSDAQSV